MRKTFPATRHLHTSAVLKTDTATESIQAEKSVGPAEKHEFLAETKQLLNIVAKSLYSENEVFIRELISNCSDALEKLKYKELSSNEKVSADIPYEISLTANDITNTLTIQDTGTWHIGWNIIKRFV